MSVCLSAKLLEKLRPDFDVKHVSHNYASTVHHSLECIINFKKLSWVAELRYLGIFLVKSRSLKCSLDAAKRGFYRAANSIFGKVGRIASEEVVIHLIRTKRVPILLSGLEALPQ